MGDLRKSQVGGGGAGGPSAPALPAGGAPPEAGGMQATFGMSQVRQLARMMGLGRPMASVERLLGPMFRAAMGGAGSGAASGAGAGGAEGMSGAMGMAGSLAAAPPVAAIAAAGVAAIAMFVALQKSAMQAREIRIESQKLGVSVGFMREMAFSARLAGVSLSDVSSGIQRVNDKADEAMAGSIASQAYFAGMGISPQALAAMQGDPQRLAQLVAARGNTAQQIQMFGSVDAAGAVARSGPSSGYERASGAALERTNLHLLESPLEVSKAAAHETLAGTAYLAEVLMRSFSTRTSPFQVAEQMNAQGRAQEAREAADRAISARQASGSKFGEGLLTPREVNAANRVTEATYDYSTLTASTGVSADTFRGRAATQRLEKEQAYNAPYQSLYERMRGQNTILQTKGEQGTLTGTQSARAMGLNIEEYADKMTRAGGLAGAYGSDTVAGYSQIVGAQEQARQSSDSRAMAEMMLRQLPQAIAQAIRDNFGFAFRRPMGPLN